MSENIARRLNLAGYPQPEYKNYNSGQQFLTVDGISLVFCNGKFIEINTGIKHNEYVGVCFDYAPPVEELLRHPFFKLSAVSFDSHKMQWQLKTFESQRENKYDYGDNLAELLGTLLAEHLEKENNGKTSKGD